jgi:L-aspartate oxidase
MGGVAADLDGRSAVAGLYAVGESACTGLHGANRLASNSLSECFVLGRRAACAALDDPLPDAVGDPPAPEPIAVPDRETREALWRDAGLVRTAEGLGRLVGSAHPLVRLVATCALARTESRGAHCRADFPRRDPDMDLRHAVVDGTGVSRWERWL